MAVKFIQRIGHGGKVRYIEVTPEAQILAEQVERGGGRFECEKLDNGAVSLVCAFPDPSSDDVDDLVDVATEIVPAEKHEVHEGVERLVRVAHTYWRQRVALN